MKKNTKFEKKQKAKHNINWKMIEKNEEAQKKEKNIATSTANKKNKRRTRRMN